VSGEARLVSLIEINTGNIGAAAPGQKPSQQAMLDG
jgi:hypothetical protein